ncbi:MAG: hypothetical protein KKC46_12885 [Proteobacteria bacterium]|nr:hypothetical protein [Pseudomonadota bacterium]
MDINFKAKHEVPMWNETRWGGCYNPKQGVGLYLHAGRLRGNLDWWWAQTIIYMPDDRIAVERSWVRNLVEDGVKTSSLDLRVRNKGWSAHYDGIVELTTTVALSKAPRGCIAPSIPARFNITADDSRPWWDMYAGMPAFKEGESGTHLEQPGQGKGTLQVGNESYLLDGVTYYDHSSGIRDWTKSHSHNFAHIVMPDYTIHAVTVYATPTKAHAHFGVFSPIKGKPLKIIQSTMPKLNDVFSMHDQYDWILQAEGDKPKTFRVEVMHTFPMTITNENDNINGFYWDAPGDPMFFTECQVKVTAPDGAVGYGHIERTNRRSCVLHCDS